MGKQSFKGIKILRKQDGRWYATKQINNKRKFFYGQTQAEVYEQLKETYNNNQKFSKDLSFYEYWQLWYEKYKKPMIKENSLKNYRSIFKNQIVPNFPDKPIKNVTSIELNNLINKIEYGRMKEYLSQFLKDCFRHAYQDRKTRFDITPDIISFHHKRGEGKALTIEERKILLKNTKKIRHGDLFEFYLFSGARPGEALNITPKDIEEEFIHIPGTKTEKSDRWIPKTQKLDEILKRQDLSNDTIFNISETTRKRELKRLNELCGFSFTTKDLRTTYGTMLAEMGIQEELIAKWLGHTSTSTTKKYYIKVLTDFEKQQKDKLDEIIRHTFDTHLDE